MKYTKEKLMIAEPRIAVLRREEPLAQINVINFTDIGGVRCWLFVHPTYSAHYDSYSYAFSCCRTIFSHYWPDIVTHQQVTIWRMDYTTTHTSLVALSVWLKLYILESSNILMVSAECETWGVLLKPDKFDAYESFESWDSLIMDSQDESV